MPFTDPVSSISGRNSRASNVSGATGASRSHRSPPPPNDTLTNAGVLSMLKTTTDTGDIGALSFNTSRLPSMPRSTHQRRGHGSRPSVSAPHNMSGATSNHSHAPSQTSRISSQWDAASTQRRGSLTSMQSMPPSIPPVHLGNPIFQMVPPSSDNPRDSRSYSLTSAQHSQPLPRHRSATSLKSQGHEPRHSNRMPPGPIPQMPENRPPFVYPTRLKRPGYRSPSPALSETYASGALPGLSPMMGRPPMAPMPGPHPSQAYAPFPPGYPGGFSQDPRHLNVRPPPRTANSSPGAYDQAHYGYRPGPMRAPGMPGMSIPGMSGMPHQMMPPPQHMMQGQQRAFQGPQYGPPRPQYAPYPHAAYPGHRGAPPANMGPMAHQMFHNAARMARHLPHRADTPMTDIPSSDPPSSGSAPTSSNPPTPKDHTTIQVMVDPAFINPDLVDLPDSSSEPVLPAKYFDYADGIEKPIHDPDMEVAHPSVPPSGFVQRVKAMLESKAAAEAAAQYEHERGARLEPGHDMEIGHETEVSELIDYHELAANETPRFTIIEEFEAPVELPASPVRIAELEAVDATQGQSMQRITREMVKAELGPSSADNTQFQADDTTTHLLITMDPRHEIESERLAEPDEEARLDQYEMRHQQAQRQSDERSRDDSFKEVADTASEAASLPTAADYAMRFSGPIDSTVTSEETQSRDHFVLDADTITLEQQQSRDVSRDKFEDVKASITPEPPHDPEYDNRQSRTPVSPLRSDEEVKRTSAVSPVQTEITLGIDETLRLATQARKKCPTEEERSNPDSSHPTESMPPPTPRTPRTYSKSVQLQPNVTVSDTASTGTNRFSLPGDLSTMFDTTINSASDMVTDIAVRFSLPGSSVTVGRPQIVNVSNSSTPDRPRQELALQLQSTTYPDTRTAKRSSVTFAEIPPLNITKKVEHHRPRQPSAEAALNKGKSIIRKPSPREDRGESNRSSRENTVELRFGNVNNLNNIGNKFASSHLPGLKEESIEDMSISEHRHMSGSDHFLLPARIAAVKAMQERRLQETADKAKARRQARQHNRSLAETRDLPSLNFSRIDLIDRLNEALEVRPTKSMDVVRRRDFSNIYCPSPQRPQSTEPLRERYTSFFSKPEDFSFFNESDDSEDEEDSEHDPEPGPMNALVPTFQIQEQTEIEGVEPAKRSLSPEDFLSVANQVQRLSIPNVNGLSDRLSELIPGLRNLSNLQLDSIFSSDRDSMYAVHDASRPDTVMTNRTSAGFRTLAERAEEIVKNGTHDSMAPLSKSLNKELPPLPESASVDKLSKISSSDIKQAYLSGSVSAPVDLGKDPARPESAVLLSKAPTTEEEVERMLPKEMNPITRNAKRSMVLSHPTSRPWNLDENYPWSGNEVEIDLSVPSAAHTRNSFASEVLRQRGTKSLDLSRPFDTTESSKGIDIGSITTTQLDTASISTEQATGITPHHARKQSKRSIIGSISKKFGLSGRATTDEDSTVKTLCKSPLPPRRTSTKQSSHKPGDRYPTSSLTPPAGFNLDEVRSFFSDNSSERDRTGSFRKRLTNFKKKSSRPDHARGQSFDGNTTYDAGMLVDEERLGASSRAHTYDGVGMSKTEFHIKRFGEKLRLFFAKGGELLRSLSTRKPGRKPGRGQDDWLADSLYSGV